MFRDFYHFLKQINFLSKYFFLTRAEFSKIFHKNFTHFEFFSSKIYTFLQFHLIKQSKLSNFCNFQKLREFLQNLLHLIFLLKFSLIDMNFFLSFFSEFSSLVSSYYKLINFLQTFSLKSIRNFLKFAIFPNFFSPDMNNF